MAWIAKSKGMLYPGYILAISARDHWYRVEFERREYGILTINDTEIMPVRKVPVYPVQLLLKDRTNTVLPSVGIAEPHSASRY